MYALRTERTAISLVLTIMILRRHTESHAEQNVVRVARIRRLERSCARGGTLVIRGAQDISHDRVEGVDGELDASKLEGDVDFPVAGDLPDIP